MSCTSLDLTIDDALADPMIAAAMRADRVDPRRFEDLLRSKAQLLGSSRRHPPAAFQSVLQSMRHGVCRATP